MALKNATIAGVIVSHKPLDEFPYVVHAWVDDPDGGSMVRHAGFKLRDSAEGYAQTVLDSQFRDAEGSF